MQAVALSLSTLLILFTGSITTSAQAPAAPPTASSLLAPALDVLRQAVLNVHADKWKADPVLRQEANTNLDSIRRDLGQTLPGLLADADAAPASLAHILPADRNVGALYDTLLRVDAVARVSAPAPQASALDQATAALVAARRKLGDSIQLSAQAQEKQLTDLKSAATAPPPVCPPPPPAPATTPTPKKKPKPKPATPPSQ